MKAATAIMLTLVAIGIGYGGSYVEQQLRKEPAAAVAPAPAASEPWDDPDTICTSTVYSGGRGYRQGCRKRNVAEWRTQGETAAYIRADDGMVLGSIEKRGGLWTVRYGPSATAQYATEESARAAVERNTQ